MWMHMDVVDYLAIVFLIARNERPLALSLVGADCQGPRSIWFGQTERPKLCAREPYRPGKRRYSHYRLRNSGSFAIFAAIRRASTLVSNLAAIRRALAGCTPGAAPQSLRNKINRRTNLTRWQRVIEARQAS